MKKYMKKIVAIFIAIIMIIMSYPISSSAATDVYESSYLKLRWLASDAYSKDTTAGARNGNVQGTVTWDTISGYNGARFSNSDIWYTVSNNLMNSGLASSVEGGIGTTIAYMAYVSDNTSSSPFFCIFNNNYNTSGYKTLFSLAPNGQIIYCNSSGSTHHNLVNALKASNGWHTYAIKFYSSKTLEIWIDGVKCYQEQSDYYDNHTFDVPNSIKVGVNRENTAYFNGTIRDFRIYNKDINAVSVCNNLKTIADEDIASTLPTTGDKDFANLINSSSVKVSYVNPTIGSTTITNDSNRIYSRNVLYASSFTSNTTATKVNGSSTYGYIVMPGQSIVLYDGKTAPVIPVKASFTTQSYETGGYSYSTFAAIYLPSNPAYSLNSTWIGLNTANCDRTTGWPSSGSGTNELGNTNVRSGYTCQVQSYYYEIGFKNGLVMNSLPAQNPTTGINFTFNQTGNESYTVTSAGSVYYVDARALYSEVENAKTQALAVASNSSKYTSSSYDNYKTKTNALINFNINNNLQTTLGASNAVTRLNTAISTAINEYKAAYSALKYKEIADLTFIDGSTDSITYDEGETPTLPDVNKCVSDSNGKHHFLNWTKGETTTVDGIKHVKYNQTASASVDCIYTSNVITESSCSSAQQTLFVCNECKYSYIETGEKLPHTMEYTDMTDGTHRGICSVCHSSSSLVFEAHTFTNYVSNNDATCTSNATETAKCDKCSATSTRAITDSALGHSYVAITVPPTCVDKGYTQYKCSVCNNTYIDENSYVQPLDHSYVAKTIADANCVSGGIIEYKCSRCDDTFTENTDVEPNMHSTMIYSRTVDATDTAEGYDIYYCSNLCGYWEKRNIIPPVDNTALFEQYLATYNDALTTVITDFNPYTAESITLYNTAVNSAKDLAQAAIESTNASDLDAATKQIIEASALLRIKTIRINIYTQDLKITSCFVDYGSNYKLQLDSVSKVTKEIDNATLLIGFSDSVDLIANEDMDITIIPTEAESSQKKYVYLDKFGKIIDINYDAKSPIAPNIPFYSFDEWESVSDNENESVYIARYIA